ncbi:MAG: glycosyltransferase [Rhodobacterales bacterium]|nr:glycosyltransferase [Rhodobacterales bacterium]
MAALPPAGERGPGPEAARIALAPPPIRPLTAAQARARGLDLIDPIALPPDRQLIDRLGAHDCLRLGLLPWRRQGGATVILTARSGLVARHMTRLVATFGPVRMAWADEARSQSAVLAAVGPALAARAETRVAAADSCRDWDQRRILGWAAALAAAVLSLALTAPAVLLLVLLTGTAGVLALNTIMKGAAAVLALRARPAPPAPVPIAADRLPIVSLLVPLYHEREIAAHLLTRLARLDYPRDRLDICLILEDDDTTTRATIAATALPDWYQVILVPRGTLRTKPRALNHALDFARGTILGIYDAEDAPAPDQLQKVVAHFATTAPDVACLQGALDYYNSTSNWLARCFTLEYASWFRVVLPSLLRMGFAIPLGGTTLFLRRDAIVEVGGWDAHNVTEDADLGIRLARHGYRTELIDTVTEEEANARVWPWIKQRSRWLKGYGVTWAVHMRNPARLWRDLGAWRFFGVQMLFLGTLSQFVLAPLLWSFWLIAVGLPHPLTALVPHGWILGLGAMFALSEVVGIAAAMIGARCAGKPRLALWAPTLQLYFPLATIAAYKGLSEIITRPFFWDKTLHGVFVPTTPVQPAASAMPQPARLRVVAAAPAARARPAPLPHPAATG